MKRLAFDAAFQVLRTIDKYDRVGAAGVAALLGAGLRDGSGAWVPGCGLHPHETAIILCYLACKGATNAATLANLRDLSRMTSRIETMAVLEETVVDDTTVWSRLLAMPGNADDSWSGGGRPANIAWALDDLRAAIFAAAPGEGGEGSP